jgi:hypothetical protein
MVWIPHNTMVQWISYQVSGVIDVVAHGMKRKEQRT